MRYEVLPSDDSSFRALCMLLAHDTAYANIPFNKTIEVLTALRHQNVIGAIADRRLVGAILWKTIDEVAAKNSITSRKLPHPNSCVDNGNAVVAIGYVSLEKKEVRPLWKAFGKQHLGKIIIFERHFLGENRESRLGWVDKTGKIAGNEL